MFSLLTIAHIIIKWPKKRLVSIWYILGPVLGIVKAKKNRRKSHSWGTNQNIVESISNYHMIGGILGSSVQQPTTSPREA